MSPFGHQPAPAAAPPPPEEPEKEKFEVIPMNADKPSGIDLGDFLPEKFRSLSMNGGSGGGSRFSNYKNYGPPSELSESEVTSTILKGHEAMMAALTTRGRNLEIIHKLWQNKDAKTGAYKILDYSKVRIITKITVKITFSCGLRCFTP